jgi:RimJ/RimL family protein N-acetyltransferase
VIALRAAAADDLPALEALARDEAIAPFLAVDTAASLPAHLAQDELYVGTADDRVIGGVRLAVVNRRSRIGDVRALMIDPRHRGRGLGAETVRRLCELAFGRLALHRVEAQVYGFNHAAIRTFERAGFTREGVRRRAFDRRGAWQDGIYLGRLADDPEGDTG